MSSIGDLSGLRFGKLFVHEQTPTRNPAGEIQWVCSCDCGNLTTVRGYSLRRGSTSSYGCARGENGKHAWTTHGKTDTREYGSWISMISRCTNKENQAYAYYGGRGIRVCARWLNSVDDFIKDVGLCPGPGYTLDRIENDGDYEPGNCRWATKEEQSNNQNRIVKYDYGGEKMSIAQIARLRNMSYSTLFDRVVKIGMTMDKAISTPIRKKTSL